MNPIIRALSVSKTIIIEENVKKDEKDEKDEKDNREEKDTKEKEEKDKINKCEKCGQFIHINNKIKKMSSSDTNGKISVLDKPKEIKKKISKIYCEDGNINDNTLLKLCRELLFPILKYLDKSFIICRPEKYGGIIEYKTYDELEKDFSDKKIYAVDFKLGIADLLIELTNGIRNKFIGKDKEQLLKDAKYL